MLVQTTGSRARPLLEESTRVTQPAQRYDVEVSPVREVSLFATADWEFWRRRLEPEGVTPAAVDGRAELIIAGASARFKGIRFRELSFSVALCRTPGGPSRDALFMVRAFNLVESDLRGREWHVREAAYHGKAKTVARSFP